MTEIKKGHVEAGGVRYGYEIHGAGAPLLLLHGGFGTLEMFGPVLAGDSARCHSLHYVRRASVGRNGACLLRER